MENESTQNRSTESKKSHWLIQWFVGLTDRQQVVGGQYLIIAFLAVGWGWEAHERKDEARISAVALAKCNAENLEYIAKANEIVTDFAVKDYRSKERQDNLIDSFVTLGNDIRQIMLNHEKNMQHLNRKKPD